MVMSGSGKGVSRIHLIESSKEVVSEVSNLFIGGIIDFFFNLSKAILYGDTEEWSFSVIETVIIRWVYFWY